MHQILDREDLEDGERPMTLGYGEVRDLSLRMIEAHHQDVTPVDIRSYRA